jgi:hypothetical protein
MFAAFHSFRFQASQDKNIEGLDDIDFYIGNEAHANSSTHQVIA